ncbi:maltose permease Mal61 [Penicillium malachiteum]|nr:maltose permease Mal61 [Penicillium malachiteum]
MTDETKNEVFHLEDAIKGIQNIREHDPQDSLPVWKVLINNYKIVGLSLFANLGGLMYGFDTMALSLCLSMTPFEQQFGQETASGYVIATWWQSVWNALSQIACMIGAWGIGKVSDMYGRRVCFILAGMVGMVGVAVLYIASNSRVFLAGKIVNGLALGMALATGQSYVSEIAPLRIRGILLSAYAFSMNLGLMISASVAFSRMAIMNSSAYKVLFAAGWVFPSLLLLLSWFVPESPHFLVQKGKKQAAEHVLEKISHNASDAPAILADIIRVHEHEEQMHNESTQAGFLDCFRGNNWRRTRIIIYCNGLTQMIGVTFQSNGPYFLTSAGMSSNNVGMIIEIGIAFSIASAIGTWFIIGVVGRRKIIMAGLVVSAMFYFLMGIAAIWSNSTALWTIGIALELTWWTMGPVAGPAMAIAGEISQARLRAQSQSIGFAFNYFFSCVWNVVVPYMFNTDEGNLGGKMGWIFLATSLISVVIVYFEFPETKDRTYEELDELFERKIPARHFANYAELSLRPE